MSGTTEDAASRPFSIEIRWNSRRCVRKPTSTGWLGPRAHRQAGAKLTKRLGYSR